MTENVKEGVKPPRGFGAHHRRALRTIADHKAFGVHVGARHRDDSSPGANDGAVAHSHTGYLERHGLIRLGGDSVGRRAWITDLGTAVLAAADKRAELTP